MDEKGPIIREECISPLFHELGSRVSRQVLTLFARFRPQPARHCQCQCQQNAAMCFCERRVMQELEDVSADLVGVRQGKFQDGALRGAGLTQPETERHRSSSPGGGEILGRGRSGPASEGIRKRIVGQRSTRGPTGGGGGSG